jgi:hypothetical protein
MTQTDALKLDPWGNPYMILGYNATGQSVVPGGPIWVVSFGPDKATPTTVNGATVLPTAWNTNGTGADDIVLRVN